MEKYAGTPTIIKPFYEAPIRLPLYEVPQNCRGNLLFERFQELFPEVLLLRELRGYTIGFSFASARGRVRDMQPRHPTRCAAINAQQCIESLTVQAFEMWKAYLLLANTILQAMFTESTNVELIAALIDARSSIALHHVEDLLRIMRTVLDAFVALEQAAVKEFTESPLAKLVNPILDFFTLRRPEEVYKKTAMGIVTSDLHDLQTYLSRCIAQASQARASIRGLAERSSLQTLVEVRRGLTGQDTLVVHCAQAASCEALREAQHWRNQIVITRMSQQFPWNRWLDPGAVEVGNARGRRCCRALACMG